jgi:hypothetical protein
MSIRLFNPSGGFIDLNAGGDGTAANVFTLPAETGTLLTTATTTGISASALSTGTLAAARLPAGSVLQVVTANTTSGATVTGTTFVDTALTQSITPSSASSKILIMVSQNLYSRRDANDGFQAQIRLMNGATELAKQNHFIRAGTGFGSQVAGHGSFSFVYLDSPNTTSSVTYKTQIALVPSYTGSNAETSSTGTQSIILMEIAA